MDNLKYINFTMLLFVATMCLICFFLQPLVENAVKHGITKRERGGTITISSRREEGYYSIKVADDNDSG